MSAPPSNPTPAFQSSQSLWPLPADAAASKSKSRNRRPPRKQAQPAAAAAPPPAQPQQSASTSTSTAAPAPKPQAQATHRTSSSWRGSGRGRGRGGAMSAGAFAQANAGGVRAMSTAAAQSSASEDLGRRVQRTPLFQGAIADSRRTVHTDSSASPSPSAPGTDSNNGSLQPSATEGGAAPAPPARRGKGGKARPPRGPSKNELLLQEAALKDGEEGGLEKEMMRLYEIQRPSPKAIAARQHLIDELTAYLNWQHFQWGHPHSPHRNPLKIEPFGSMRFGLGTSSSDLDLCLLDPYRPHGFEEKWYSSKQEVMQELPDIYQMRKLGNALRRAGLSNVNPISGATVPICKFEVRIDGQLIQADLNTNERLGLFNSRLINSYCNLHPLVRPLSVFIKFWAKQRGLNDPSGRIVTFSSYTLILLVIAYLQRINLLPNLQNDDLIARTSTPRQRFFSTPKAYGRRGKLKHLIRSVGWDVTFVEYENPPAKYEPTQADLVELARGFFHYWADEFEMGREVVSISNGGPFERKRTFPPQKPPKGKKAVVKPGEEDKGEVSLADRQRQEAEDEALALFAAEAQRATQPQVDDPQAELDAIAAQELAAERAQDEAANPSASRSSSPIAFEEFFEPENWAEHMLVVQDPFILTRNCAGNVHPDWVEELRVQMRRARDLIDARAPLSEICASSTSDPSYRPVAVIKKAAKEAQVKAQRQKQREEEQRRAQEAKAERMRMHEEAMRRQEEEKAARKAAKGEAKDGVQEEEGETAVAGEVSAGQNGGTVVEGKQKPEEVVEPAKEAETTTKH
ncbi:hypothetical protein JCM5296_004030 [Sporobolomyces johnsonii]